MILVIDNYDSFVENLARYVRLCGHRTLIIRNDKITIEEIKTLNPDGVVISPGPCTPDEAGISIELIKQFYKKTPILGVCLGHQAIVSAFGGVVKQTIPHHGRTSPITHDKTNLFETIPSPTKVGRYHSLICELPNSGKLIETARTDDGLNMALQHREYPLYGVQFHPESILTEHGMIYIQNFLKAIPR
jgi:para-aminobenzoate synthetase component 2